MKFADIVELLKEKKGLTSAEATWKYLGLSRSGYYHMLSGYGGLKDATVRKIMDGTGLPAPEIEAAWKAEHARDPEVKRSWQKWLARVASFLPACALLTALLPADPAEAHSPLPSST